MKAIPFTLRSGERIPCGSCQAIYLRFKFGNEEDARSLPIQIKGKREGTGNWTWNGCGEKPTLKPSILTTFPEGYDGISKEIKCHVWVTDGVVQHLSDCTCGHAGESHPLEDIEPNELEN